MSGELVAVVVGIVLAIAAAFGLNTASRRRPSSPSSPPPNPVDEVARDLVDEDLGERLEEVADAAASSSPERDAADILNRRRP
jgi:hypothetical protein